MLTAPKKKPKAETTTTSLTPELTGSVVTGLKKQGTKFYRWEEFQNLTKDLPPETKISRIIPPERPGH